MGEPWRAPAHLLAQKIGGIRRREERVAPPVLGLSHPETTQAAPQVGSQFRSPHNIPRRLKAVMSGGCPKVTEFSAALSPPPQVCRIVRKFKRGYREKENGTRVCLSAVSGWPWDAASTPTVAKIVHLSHSTRVKEAIWGIYSVRFDSCRNREANQN